MNTMSAQTQNLINEMTADYINEVAKTIWAQVKWSVESFSVLWSWGVSRKVATTYRNMPALALRVSGLVHKGWVYICLNESRDVYEVYCVSLRAVEKNANKEVYCDNLGFVLDAMIEKPLDMGKSEYANKARKDSERKIGMKII